MRKDTVMNAVCYWIAVVVITGIGMTTVEKITTSDQTVKVAASVENFNLLLEDKSILARYDGSDEEKMFQANIDIIKERAEQAARNEATLLVLPVDAFVCPESSSGKLIDQTKSIARLNDINILIPILRVQQEGKKKNTLNFINTDAKLLNIYPKNHLVPVVEEPETERGDGKTPILEVDGVHYISDLCR